MKRRFEWLYKQDKIIKILQVGISEYGRFPGTKTTGRNNEVIVWWGSALIIFFVLQF